MAKKSKLKGFGLKGGGNSRSPTLGFVGRDDSDERTDVDPAFDFRAGGVVAPPREPILRVANVGSLGAGVLLHLFGVKHALVSALAVNFVDVVARQVNEQYRTQMMLGPWNTGVL